MYVSVVAAGPSSTVRTKMRSPREGWTRKSSLRNQPERPVQVTVNSVLCVLLYGTIVYYTCMCADLRSSAGDPPADEKFTQPYIKLNTVCIYDLFLVKGPGQILSTLQY